MKQRDWLVKRREHLLLSRAKLGSLCGCSEYTIRMLEEDDTYVTHPLIVRKISRVLKLKPKQADSMLPANYRPGPDYDLDKFKVPDSMKLCMPKDVPIWRVSHEV